MDVIIDFLLKEKNVILMCIVMIAFGIINGAGFIFSNNRRLPLLFGKEGLLILLGTELIAFFKLYEYKENRITPLIFLLFSSIVTSGIFFSYLKKENKKLTLYGYIVDPQGVVNSYLEESKKRISEELNIENLEKKAQEILERERELEKQEALNVLERRAIDKEICTISRIPIPVRKSIPVDDYLISYIPSWYECLFNFQQRSIIDIYNYTELIIKNNKKFDYEYAIAILTMIGCNFCACFFHDNEARMHFRILQKDKYIAFLSYPSKSTDIPKEFKKQEGVFKYLGQTRKSIVRSKNSKIFAYGSNPMWQDCLSGAISYSNDK